MLVNQYGESIDFIMGYPVEDVIAMAQEIRKGNYSPDDPDWDAFKAGYKLGYKQAHDELVMSLRKTVDSMDWSN